MAASQTLTAYHLRVAELKIAKTCARQKIHALPMQFVLQGITEPDVNAPQASKGMLEASVKGVRFLLIYILKGMQPNVFSCILGV